MEGDGGGSMCKGALGVTWALASLATLSVLLRLWTRIFVRSFLGLDDLCMTLGLILAIITSAGITVQIRHGLGADSNGQLTQNVLGTSMRWGYIVVMLSFLAILFIRTSVCLYTLRKIPQGQRKPWTLRTILLTACLSVLAALFVVITFAVQCVPLSQSWVSSTTPPQCTNPYQLGAILVVANSFSALADLACVILPAAVLRYPTATRRQKFEVGSVILLGMIPVGCAIARTTIFVHPSNSSLGSLLPTYLGVVEIWLGVIAASLPTLKPLIHRGQSETCFETTSFDPSSPTSNSDKSWPCNKNVLAENSNSWTKLKAFPGDIVRTNWRHLGSLSNSDKSIFFERERKDSLADFPDLVPQIGRSSVVKRMDVEVELSRATDSEVALTDKELYASWDDPPEEGAVENDNGQGPCAKRQRSKQDLHSNNRPASSRPRAARRGTIAKAEALQLPCAKDGKRSWFSG